MELRQTTLNILKKFKLEEQKGLNLVEVTLDDVKANKVDFQKYDHNTIVVIYNGDKISSWRRRFEEGNGSFGMMYF